MEIPIDAKVGGSGAGQCMECSDGGKVPWDERKLSELGRELVAVAGKHQRKFLDLCIHIRKEQMPPKVVSRVLLAVGFRKERISEIKAVSYVSSVIWEDFQKRLIGFRCALSQARQEKQEPEVKARLEWMRFQAAFERLMVKSKRDSWVHVYRDRVLLVVPNLGSPQEMTVGEWHVRVTLERANSKPKRAFKRRKKHDKK